MTPARLFSPEPQILKAVQPAEFRRNRARQVVVSEPEPLKAGQIAEFRRDCSRQLVAAQPQPIKAGKAPELRRDDSRELVGVQEHLLKAAKTAQSRWDGARQVVLLKAQPCDPARVIRLDSMPLPDWDFGEPVPVAVPLRTAGPVVERHQGGAVIHCAVVHACAREEPTQAGIDVGATEPKPYPTQARPGTVARGGTNAPLSIRPPSGTVARGGTNAPLPTRERWPSVTILSIVAPRADHGPRGRPPTRCATLAPTPTIVWLLSRVPVPHEGVPCRS